MVLPETTNPAAVASAITSASRFLTKFMESPKSLSALDRLEASAEASSRSALWALSLDTAAFVASLEQSEAMDLRATTTSSEASETVVEIVLRLCAAFQAPDGSVITRASRAITHRPG